MRRRPDRRATVSLESLECRNLLSSTAATPLIAASSRSRAIFTKLEKTVNRDDRRVGRTSVERQIAREEVTILQDDLYILGFFERSARSKPKSRAGARNRIEPAADPSLNGQPPTESQILAGFQNDYEDAILGSAPDAAQLLVDDATLALDTWDVISPIILDGPAGVPEAIAQLNEKTPDIYDDIDSILDNPLFDSSPSAQDMVIGGQELGLEQASSNQPIELPPTPGIEGNPPPVETGPGPSTQAAISVSPNSLTFTAIAGGSSPVPQTITVTNSGTAGSTLEFVASASLSSPFPVQIDPSSGNVVAGASTTLSVSVDPSALAPGTYTSSILISDPQSSNQYVTVPIKLIVTATTTYTGTIQYGGFDANFNPISGSSSIALVINEGDATQAGEFSGTVSIPSIAGASIQEPIIGTNDGSGSIMIQATGSDSFTVDLDGKVQSNGSLLIDDWAIEPGAGGFEVDSSQAGSKPIILSP